jgi:hypothetical protein
MAPSFLTPDRGENRAARIAAVSRPIEDLRQDD